MAMPLNHDRKHAQKYLHRIEAGTTLAFCCVELTSRVTLFHAKRTSSAGGLKAELKDAAWAGQPALRKDEKTGSRLVAQGFLRLEGGTLLLDSTAAESQVEKRLRDYFRTGFGLSLPWDTVRGAELASQATEAGDEEPESREPESREPENRDAGGGEDEAPAEEVAGGAADNTAADLAQAEAPPAPAKAEAPPEPAVLAILKTAMERTMPALREAMRRHPDQRGALTALAGAFLAADKAGDASAAEQQLLLLRARLDALPAQGGAVAYAKLRLQWDAARNGAAADLQALEVAILQDLAGEPEYEEARLRVRKLDQVLSTLGTALQDKLDEAANAAGPERLARQGEALEIIARYRQYVDGDPFVAAIDANPFTPVVVQARLSSALAGLAAALAA
jgi:hypothetical protein